MRLIIRIATFLRMDAAYFQANEKWYREQTNPLQFYLVKAARMLPESFRWNLERSFLRRFVFGNADAETPDVTFVWTTVSRRLPREIYDEPDGKLRFEDDYYPVPKGYDEYLRIMYKDYMAYPPEEKRLPAFGLFFNAEQEWDAVTMSHEEKESFQWKTIAGQSNN